MMVVIATMGVLMSLVASVTWSAFRIHGAATAAVAELQSEARLADRFREDVASARETPEFAGDFQASPLCFILGGNNAAFILYRRAGQTMERTILGEGDPTTESFPIAGAEGACEFRREGRLITMTLSGPTRGTLAIASTLGGNQP